MSILFIRGISDKNTARLVPDKDGCVTFTYEGCCGVYWFMDFASMGADEITLFSNKVEQQVTSYAGTPSLIFNEISEPDSHHGALVRCVNFCEQLQVPTINHPEKILQTRRDNVSMLLRDIPGVMIPKSVRFTPASPEDVFTEIDNAGLDLPVIIRIAGSHGGDSSLLIGGKSDLNKLNIYPFDGSVFYLTQFVDYRSSDDYYRKHRIAMIGGVPVLRHLLINKTWMIHASSRLFMNENQRLREESDAYHQSFDEKILPQIKPAIDEIAKRVQLDYFGIDCNIDAQGNLLIFEVNANMNFLYNDYLFLKDTTEKIKQQILKLIERKQEHH